jgi:hypothetical protein
MAQKLCKGTHYSTNKRINSDYFSFFMNFRTTTLECRGKVVTLHRKSLNR